MRTDQKLPKPPQVDLEKSDAEQKVLAAKSPYSAPNNREFARAYAIIKETEMIPVELRSQFQIEDYAKSLADVGRFEDAAKLDTPNSDLYAKLHRAVWRDDDEICDCSNLVTIAKQAQDATDPNSSVTEREVEIGSHFTLREMFSPKHGRVMPVRMCNKCGDLNVSV